MQIFWPYWRKSPEYSLFLGEIIKVLTNLSLDFFQGDMEFSLWKNSNQSLQNNDFFYRKKLVNCTLNEYQSAT